MKRRDQRRCLPFRFAATARGRPPGSRLRRRAKPHLRRQIVNACY